MAATGASSEGPEASRGQRGMAAVQDEYPAELRLKVCQGMQRVMMTLLPFFSDHR